MQKKNIRYGVVDASSRVEFEKEWHLPFAYSHLTYNMQDAIEHCKKIDNPNFIVEEIYDCVLGKNFKTEIYRSGKE